MSVPHCYVMHTLPVLFDSVVVFFQLLCHYQLAQLSSLHVLFNSVVVFFQLLCHYQLAQLPSLHVLFSLYNAEISLLHYFYVTFEVMGSIG